MSYFGNKQEGEKILRGAFTFSRNNNIYSEESFEVYREKKTLSFSFYSEQISRVSTGELLTITSKYRINNDYIPLEVSIDRSLGSQNVKENYIFDPKYTYINYTFENSDGIQTAQISTQPKFFIATSSACTSMLCLRSKKLDTSGKNYYSFLTSKNMWQFTEDPAFKNVVIQRLSQTTENLKLEGSVLQGMRYKLTEGAADENADISPDNIKIWVSQHMTVPYLIEGSDGTKMQIKYLNNLDRD